MTTAANAPETSTRRRYQLFINGKFVDAKSGKTFETIFPHDRSVQAVVAEGDKADIDDAVVAARARLRRRWGDDAAERARAAPAAHGRPASRSGRRTWRSSRRLDVGMPAFLATGMVMSRGRRVPVLGGLGDEDPRLHQPVDAARRVPRLHAARAARRRRRHHAVERPAHHGDLEDGAGARVRQRGGAEARRAHADDRDGAGAHRRRRRHPRRRLQRRAGLRTRRRVRRSRSIPDVDKIAFTGEYVTGRLVVQMSTSNLKTVTLELGGKSPHIIFDDVDLESRGGQRALRPLHQHRPDLLRRARGSSCRTRSTTASSSASSSARSQITVGNPLDFATRMGPLVSEEQLHKVRALRPDRHSARAPGCVCGGGRPKDAELANGFYHEPTVFADVDQSDADRAGGDLRPGRQRSFASTTRTTRYASATT